MEELVKAMSDQFENIEGDVSVIVSIPTLKEIQLRKGRRAGKTMSAFRLDWIILMRSLRLNSHKQGRKRNFIKRRKK